MRDPEATRRPSPRYPAHAMTTKWSIGRRQGACAVTGRAFVDGERHASLVEVLEGELVRRDLAWDVWEARERSGAPAPLCWWVTRHRINPSRSVQLDLEGLEQLFERLEGRPEVAVRELRYLLCLLLMRKRKLAIERVERGPEGERMVVRRPRREERFEVFVYDFTPERMGELRAELQAIFDGADGPDGLRFEGGSGDGDAEPAGDSAQGAAEEPAGEPAEEPAGEPGGTRWHGASADAALAGDPEGRQWQPDAQDADPAGPAAPEAQNGASDHNP